MRISACPRCGSKNISAGTMRSGILYGISSWTEECRDCGFKGSPIVFDSEEAYLVFLKKVKMKPIKKRKTKSTKERTSDLSQKENEIVENLNELTEEDKTIDREQVLTYHWHARNWWVEIGLAIVIAVVISLFGVLRNISLMGFGMGFFYSMLEFIIYFILLLIVIVIIEYFFHLFKNSVKK